jgi:hypothetical protein
LLEFYGRFLLESAPLKWPYLTWTDLCNVDRIDSTPADRGCHEDLYV